MQAQEVVGLQEHVAELGVGDALVRPLEPALDRLLAHHLVHGEVLPHVAEEVKRGQLAQPLAVVEEEGVGQIEELGQLGADALEVPVEHLWVKRDRSSCFPPGSPIMPVPPPARAMGR